MNSVKVYVMSREKARKYSFKNNTEPYNIISITDVNSDINHFANNPMIKSILRLQFDDVCNDEQNCITKEQAKQIINFVNKTKDICNVYVVHCEAGVSRSAGVAAAILYIYNHDDSEIFDKWKYCPNSACYNAILEAEYGSIENSIFAKKEEQNLNIWKEHYKENL